MVRASSSAWVGCSCAPSPALTTPARRLRARKCGTPGQEWRMTIRSGAMACRFRAVSRSDSPFSTELPFAAKERASAESHFSAVSKEKRVRVEDSKKRLTTIRPRSAGTFLICRSPIGRMDSAVSRMSPISAAESSSVPRRSLERSAVGVNLSGGSLEDPDLVGAVGLLEHDLDDLALGRGDALADVVRLDGDLAVAPVDQHREANRAGPAEVDQAVQRGPHGAARVEHVVAEDDSAAVQVEVDLGLLQERLRGDQRKVVAIERDVEGADGEGLLDEVSQRRGQPGRQRDAASADADEGQVRKIAAPLGDLVGHAIDHPANAVRVEDPRLLDQSVGQVPASLWAVPAEGQACHPERGSRTAKDFLDRTALFESRGFLEKILRSLRFPQNDRSRAVTMKGRDGSLQLGDEGVDGEGRLLRAGAVRQDDQPAAAS